MKTWTAHARALGMLALACVWLGTGCGPAPAKGGTVVVTRTVTVEVPAPPAPPPPPHTPAFPVRASASPGPGPLATSWRLSWKVEGCAKVDALEVVHGDGSTWRALPAALEGEAALDTGDLAGIGPYVAESVAVQATCYDGRKAYSLPVALDVIRGEGWELPSSLGAGARLQWMGPPSTGEAFWACVELQSAEGIPGGPALVKLSASSAGLAVLSMRPWPSASSWCPEWSRLAGDWLLARHTDSGPYTVLFNLRTGEQVMKGWLYDALELPGGEVLVSRGDSLAKVSAAGTVVWEAVGLSVYTFETGAALGQEYGEAVVRFFTYGYTYETDTSHLRVSSLRLSDGAQFMTRTLMSYPRMSASGTLMVDGRAFVALADRDAGGRTWNGRLLACELGPSAPCTLLPLPAGSVVAGGGGYVGTPGALVWLRGTLHVTLADGRLARYAGGTGEPVLFPNPRATTMEATADGALVGTVGGYGRTNTYGSGKPYRPRAVYGVTASGAYTWQWQAAPDEDVAGAVGGDGRWWMASGGWLVRLHPDDMH